METFHKADFAQSSVTVDQIIAFGPDGHGSNILINCIPEYSERSNFWSQKMENLRNLDQQVLSGFQVATSSGPMMEEPMAGVGFRLLNWKTKIDFDLTLTSGQLISTVKEACRKSGRENNGFHNFDPPKKFPVKFDASTKKCNWFSSLSFGKINFQDQFSRSGSRNPGSRTTPGRYLMTYIPYEVTALFLAKMDDS